jgi:prolyl oligopeptidase
MPRVSLPARSTIHLATLLLATACSTPTVTPTSPPAHEPAVPHAHAYPLAREATTVDDYHGTRVADPYRWLEADSPETAAWIAAENTVTQAFLQAIPQRAAIRARLEKVWNYPRVQVPVREGGRLFFRKNDGLQNQAVLYVQESDGKPRVLLDPNTLRADGTVALHDWAPSRDGKKLAYGLAAAGSDWVDIHVRDVQSGTDAGEVLHWVKFSGISWDKPNEGFYYSRYDAPKAGAELTGAIHFQKLYYHRLGTPQERDVLVYERKDQPEWGFGGTVSEDGRWLLIPVWMGADSKNALFYRALDKDGRLDAKQKVVELIADFRSEWAFAGNAGPVFWLRTTEAAPKGRLVAVDVRKPAVHKDLLPEGDGTLDSVGVVGDRFIAHSIRNATSEVRIHKLDGTLERTWVLPALGTVGGFTGHEHESETFYVFESFLQPASVYRHDLKTGATEVFAQPDVGAQPDAFETSQVWVPSQDGTKVSMFVVHKKGLVLDGSHPTLLYGYGGFNISLTPSFSPAVLVWLQMGGVYAMPNLRGGGEYGTAWHEAGMKAHKQRVFDDFLAAAQWLVTQKYTSPGKLAISGGSNGGLLVGACLSQRPELFGAALPAVGVLDMLRFHKFTIGWAWVPEYGSADDAQDFAVLRAYSPLHNLKPGTHYPATLITTADHDDRVVPAHSFKFAAALQKAQAGPAPVLIRIETRAGHGAGKPTTKLIDEVADKWAFLVRALGMQL